MGARVKFTSTYTHGLLEDMRALSEIKGRYINELMEEAISRHIKDYDSLTTTVEDLGYDLTEERDKFTTTLEKTMIKAVKIDAIRRNKDANELIEKLLVAYISEERDLLKK